MNSSTDLLFDPSSSSLAPGSIISSCLSLQYPLFENINFNDHVCKILCFKISSIDHVCNIICFKTSTFDRSGFHLSFSSAARSFLSFSNQALAYSPHLISESRHLYNEEGLCSFLYSSSCKREICTFLCRNIYLRKIPGTFSMASSISSGVMILGKYITEELLL